MRVLASTTAGAGHLGPMVPVLQACGQAGHDVLVACPESFTSQVARLGFSWTAFDDSPREEWAAVVSRLPGLSHDEANRIVVGEIFARINTTAALPRLTETVDEWRPDLIIRDPSEYASWILAERFGVPSVRVSITLLAADLIWSRIAAQALSDIATADGFTPDPAGTRLSAGPILAAAPASFDPPGELDAAAVHRYGEVVAREHVLPPQVPEGDEPLVYVTFGTVAASLGLWPSLYRPIVDALADLPVRVLVTSGEGVEVSQLGPLPPQTAVATFVPQDHVLAHAAVMVAHGGFGTVLGGLRAGVPMVLAPLFADQPYNAARVEELGAGITVGTSHPATVVRPGLVAEVPASEVRAAVLRLLEDTAPRLAVRRLAQEMASHPSISSLVPLLKRIASRVELWGGVRRGRR
ncbi:MAG: glycosyltransferase [Actinomycetota bacterium]|nr:glycosyltransferase [Actinomycetota bacterium]